jgi:hypothetical protein
VFRAAPGRRRRTLGVDRLAAVDLRLMDSGEEIKLALDPVVT